MRINLNFLDKRLLKIIKLVGHRADQLNLQVYLVGGIVRDVLLRRKNFDLDFVVVGESLELLKLLSRELKIEFVYHKAFRTATMTYNNIRIDIACARKESYQRPGSLPEVKLGSLQDDLFRRDFTINAMAISLNNKSWGELIDPYTGLEDLNKRKIKILHRLSFQDDATRILRAIRFEQRFKFLIEKNTLILLRKAIKEDFIDTIKPPRYFAEFKKILKEENPVVGLKRLQGFNGLSFFCLKRKISSEKLGRIYYFLKKENNFFVKENLWLIYSLAILQGFSQVERENIAKKFHFKNEEKRVILDVLLLGELLKGYKRSSAVVSSQVYRQLKHYSIEAVLYFLITEQSLMIKKILEKYVFVDRFLSLQISGDDLKKIGIGEGKRVGEILDQVLDKKIDFPRRLRTKRQELEFAKQLSLLV